MLILLGLGLKFNPYSNWRRQPWSSLRIVFTLPNARIFACVERWYIWVTICWLVVVGLLKILKETGNYLKT